MGFLLSLWVLSVAYLFFFGRFLLYHPDESEPDEVGFPVSIIIYPGNEEINLVSGRPKSWE